MFVFNIIMLYQMEMYRRSWSLLILVWNLFKVKITWYIRCYRSDIGFGEIKYRIRNLTTLVLGVCLLYILAWATNNLTSVKIKNKYRSLKLNSSW